MSTETTEIDKNLWQAFISEPYGFCYTDPDEIAEQLADENAEATEISIRRRSALPTNKDGGLRHPGTYTSADIFVEIDLEDIDEPEDRVAAWELAKKAAWGMSLDVEALLAGFREDLVNGLDAAMGACPHDQVSSEWDLCNACAADAAVKVLRELLEPAAVPAVTADGSDQDVAKEN